MKISLRKLSKKYSRKVLSIVLTSYFLLSPLFSVAAVLPAYAATVAPVASIDAPAPGGLVSGDLDVYMTVTDDGNLDFYRIQIQDSIGTKVYDPGKVFVSGGDLSGFSNRLIDTWDTTGLNGIYTLFYVAKDADPQGTWLNFDFEVDNTAPAVPSLVGPVDGIETGSAGLILDWTDETDTNGPVTYNYQSSWPGDSYGPVSVGINSQINASGSAERTYAWQVQSCDALDNCSAWSGPWEVTVDDTPPAAPTPTSPADGAVINNEAFSQTWEAVTDAVEYGYESCAVDPGDIGATCGIVKWTANYAGTTKNVGAGQPNSQFWWRVKAKDTAGNWSDYGPAFELVIDAEAPVSIMDAGLDNSLHNSPITISGETTDNLGVDFVSLYYRVSTGAGDSDWSGKTLITTVATEVDDSWTYDWTPPFDGVYDIMAAGTDDVGNIESSAYAYVVTYDSTSPTDPIKFATNPEVNTPVQENTITVAWSAVDSTADPVIEVAGIVIPINGATDNLSEVKGYSYSFTQGATDVPDDTQDIDASVTQVTSNALEDSKWYFHLRTVDNAGNWTSTEHVGPFILDNTDPTDPVKFAYTPDINTPVQENQITVAWPAVDSTEDPVIVPSIVVLDPITGATDDLSDVDGYSYSFTKGATDVPDDVKDLEEDITQITSVALEDGSWYFHLRTVDYAGNWTNTQHVGPFVFDNAPPEITLAGEPIVNVLLGSVYADAGATAIDATDGDLTASVVAVNSVNTAVEGLYTVVYNVTDSAGNAASEVTRAVNVIAPAPIAAVLGVEEEDLPVTEAVPQNEGNDGEDGGDDNGEVKGEETTSDDSETTSPTFDWWWAIYLLGGSMLVYIVWFWFFRKKDTY